jgi:hypothetical protein
MKDIWKLIIMKYLVLFVGVLIVLSLVGCAGLGGTVPDIEAVGSVDAESIGEIEHLTNTITTTNIPIKYVLWYGVGWWCVRTPFSLLGDLFRFVKNMVLPFWRTK